MMIITGKGSISLERPQEKQRKKVYSTFIFKYHNKKFFVKYYNIDFKKHQQQLQERNMKNHKRKVKLSDYIKASP